MTIVRYYDPHVSEEERKKQLKKEAEELWSIERTEPLRLSYKPTPPSGPAPPESASPKLRRPRPKRERRRSEAADSD